MREKEQLWKIPKFWTDIRTLLEKALCSRVSQVCILWWVCNQQGPFICPHPELFSHQSEQDLLEQEFWELEIDQTNKRSCGVEVRRMVQLLSLLSFPWDYYYFSSAPVTPLMSGGKPEVKKKALKRLICTCISILAVTSPLTSFLRFSHQAEPWGSRDGKPQEKHLGGVERSQNLQ